MTILVVLHFFLAVGLYEVFHTFAPASLPLSAPLATPTSAAPPSPLLLPTSSSLLHWWLSLHKLVVYCPGLLHDNVVLDPCYFGLEHNISPDQSFSLPCSTSSAMCDVFLSGNICPSAERPSSPIIVGKLPERPSLEQCNSIVWLSSRPSSVRSPPLQINPMPPINCFYL